MISNSEGVKAAMPTMSREQVIGAVAQRVNDDPDYYEQLATAIERKQESWVARLIKVAVGGLKVIGKALLSAIIYTWLNPNS